MKPSTKQLESWKTLIISDPEKIISEIELLYEESDEETDWIEDIEDLEGNLKDIIGIRALCRSSIQKIEETL